MSQVLEFEYLGTPERQARRWPRLVAAAVAALAVLTGAFLWWSEQQRAEGNAELASAFARATKVADAGERRVQASVVYVSPLVWSPDIDETLRADLWDIVEGSAADVAADLQAVRERAVGTQVLPWHEEQTAARDALVALIDAQRERFLGIARDARNIDLILADGPLPTGPASQALRASGAEVPAAR